MVSLIAGMNDIIEYITKLGKENKELKETCERQGEDVLEYYKCKETIDKQEKHLDIISNTWFHPSRWGDEPVYEYTDIVDNLYKESIEQKIKIKELEEKVDEGLKYKELKELYEGRANGMEDELNKIKKLVGIEEDDIPEPYEVLTAVNKLNEDIKELKEFKEKTEEECGASAVMEDMIKRLDEAERKEKMWYECYKNQEPMVKANREQNEKLVKMIMKSYDLLVSRGDWENRFDRFYWNVMTENRNVDWNNILDDVGIECRNWDYIKEDYFDDKEIREKYCESDYVEYTQIDKIINDEDEDYDWNEQEDNFIDWYIGDYMDACEYTCIDEDYYMLVR